MLNQLLFGQIDEESQEILENFKVIVGTVIILASPLSIDMRHKTIQLWDITNGQLQMVFKGHSSEICSITFSPDGQTLATSSNYTTIRIWDLSTSINVPEQTPRGHNDQVQSIKFSPDGQQLASISLDRTVKLWNTKTGKAKETISDTIICIDFSPDGKLLASGFYDGIIQIWDIENATITPWKTLKGHLYSVASVSSSLDGQILVSGSPGNTVKKWDITTGELLKTSFNPFEEVSFLARSPRGCQLVSCSYDGTVNIYEHNLEAKCSFGWNNDGDDSILPSWSSPIHSVCFSPDGKLLACSTSKATKIWDFNGGELQCTLTGHSYMAWSGLTRYPYLKMHGYVLISRKSCGFLGNIAQFAWQ